MLSEWFAAPLIPREAERQAAIDMDHCALRRAGDLVCALRSLSDDPAARAPSRTNLPQPLRSPRGANSAAGYIDETQIEALTDAGLSGLFGRCEKQLKMVKWSILNYPGI
jgi:hypothetical protein